MVAFHTDLINMIVPVIVIAIPAFIAYTYLPSRTGFMAGAIIGIAVGYSGGIIDDWVVVLGILALSSIIFIDNKENIHLGDQ